MRSNPGKVASRKWILMGLLSGVQMSRGTYSGQREAMPLISSGLENHILFLGFLDTNQSLYQPMFPTV